MMNRRLVFVLYTFVPATMFFFLPLIFFRIPMPVDLNENRMAWVAAHDVGRAAAVALVWFSTAIGVLLWPTRQGSAAPERRWAPRAVWYAFVGFSIVGSAISLAHSILVAPCGLEELVHQAAFAPLIGFVLGLFVLRDLAGKSAAMPRTIVGSLMLLDLCVALGLPILLAKVTPAAFGIVALLYGVTVTGVPPRRVAVIALAAALVVLAMLPTKDFLRMYLFRWDAFQRAAIAACGRPAHLRTERTLPAVQPSVGAVVQDFSLWGVGLRLPRAPRPLLLVEFGLATAMHRINRLADLAYAVSLTPKKIPYAGGATYVPVIGSLVPRLIWRTKPADEAGQFYGHRYGFLDPDDTQHSINLPMVTEGWVNAGWAGVVLSAAFVGFVLRLIWLFAIGPGSAPGNVLIGMAVVGSAVDGESNLSLVVGGVLHALLVYGAIAVAIGRWARTPEAN